MAHAADEVAVAVSVAVAIVLIALVLALPDGHSLSSCGWV